MIQLPIIFIEVYIDIVCYKAKSQLIFFQKQNYITIDLFNDYHQRNDSLTEITINFLFSLTHQYCTQTDNRKLGKISENVQVN